MTTSPPLAREQDAAALSPEPVDAPPAAPPPPRPRRGGRRASSGAPRTRRPVATDPRVERANRLARSVGVSVSLLALALVGLVLYLTVLSSLAEARTQENLFKTFRGELADAVAPVGPTTPGAPVAIVSIPRLGLRAVVVEGTASGQLLDGPGHRRDTPLPGQPGTSVVYGHRSIAGRPFAQLGRLRPGDTITVVTGQSGDLVFRVTGLRDSRQAASVRPSNAPGLTLVTADPPWQPTHTLIVSATLVGSPQPSGGGGIAVGPAERSLAGDGDGLLSLVLWGQALVVVAVAVPWLAVRWAAWPTYLVATPVVLAVLWNVYEAVARMLPNLL